MATPTYTPIASITLGSSASSVTFSSIPQDYRDLVLVVDANYGTGNTSTAWVRFNSDSGSNYNDVVAQGSGTSTASSSRTGVNVGFIGPISDDDDTLSIVQIMDYSATDKHKTFLTRENRASGFVAMRALRWGDTSAINTILISNDGSDLFIVGSTFALYGIEA